MCYQLQLRKSSKSLIFTVSKNNKGSNSDPRFSHTLGRPGLVVKLKKFVVNRMIDAVLMSTYTLNSLFVLITYIILLIFRIVVR